MGWMLISSRFNRGMLQAVKCSTCKKSFAAETLISAGLRKLLIAEHDTIVTAGDSAAAIKLSTDGVDQLKWAIQLNEGRIPDGGNDRLRALYVAVLQWSCNMHSAVHHATCFKKSKCDARECRFRYPMKPVKRTRVKIGRVSHHTFARARLMRSNADGLLLIDG